jgi:hypothetical protein
MIPRSHVAFVVLSLSFGCHKPPSGGGSAESAPAASPQCIQAYTDLAFFVGKSGGDDTAKAELDQGQAAFMQACGKTTSAQTACLTGDLSSISDNADCKTLLDPSGALGALGPSVLSIVNVGPKAPRCQKAFTNVESFLVAQMAPTDTPGGADDVKKDFEASKDKFMQECQKLNNQQIDCLTGDLSKAADDPKCKDALDGLGD